MLRYAPFNLLAGPLLFLASLTLAAPGGATTPAAAADPVAVLETKMALRDLWVEHVFWIRSYVLAADAGDDRQAAGGHDPARCSIDEQAARGGAATGGGAAHRSLAFSSVTTVAEIGR